MTDIFGDFRRLVIAALDDLAARGELPSGLDFGRVAVEPPRDPAHGDLATNAAMVLAGKCQAMPPPSTATKAMSGGSVVKYSLLGQVDCQPPAARCHCGRAWLATSSGVSGNHCHCAGAASSILTQKKNKKYSIITLHLDPDYAIFNVK